MIKLSSKGYYALKSVLFIAKKDELLKVSDIAIELNISLGMLRRIIADLEKGGILNTFKGRNGGVKIGKELKEISIYDILLYSGEELSIKDCAKGLDCEGKTSCGTVGLLKGLQRGFNTLLKINTLDKLIKK